ncbi:MAG: DsbA family protein [archaeon]
MEENFDNNESKPNRAGSFTDKCRTNPWIASTFALGIIVLIFLIINFTGGLTGSVISEKKAGEFVMDFVNSQVSGAELVNINDDGNLYEVNVLYDGQTIPLYITKDGKYFINGVIPLTTLTSSSSSGTQTQDILKSDKPVVELFVMTHCPYGTQAEKGLIPAIEELGDSIDAKIRFVHYFMHEPEETETPRQVCIREEQSDKFLSYLECFLEDGDSARCVEKVGINEAKMNECVSSGRADDYYAEDSALSKNYGVQGSPTLVVNGKIVSSSRSPSAFLDAICSAFNDSPKECSAELSSENPSAGFGWDGTGSSTNAQC